jgi:hypothetical protein
MLPGHAYIDLSAFIHRIEEVSIPLPAPSTAVKVIALGIPVAVLIHDLSDLWFPKKRSLPMLTYFRRRWVSDPNNKQVDLMLFRNVALFVGIAAVMHGGIPKNAPVDYICDRLTSASARRAIDRDIHEKRTASLEAANKVMAAHAYDEAKAMELRQNAVERRASQGDRVL